VQTENYAAHSPNYIKENNMMMLENRDNDRAREYVGRFAVPNAAMVRRLDRGWINAA